MWERGRWLFVQVLIAGRCLLYWRPEPRIQALWPYRLRVDNVAPVFSAVLSG